MATRMTGFNELASRMNRLSANIQREVKETVEFYAGEIEVEAIRNAPGPGSQVSTQQGTEPLSQIVNGRGWTPVSQAIGYSIGNQGYSAEIFIERSAGDVAIWIEMGTGQDATRYLATVPPEWASEARKYYINGRGTILAKPYLLPAFLRNKPLMIQELKNILRNATL